MSENHSGKYTCHAENDGGSAESTADIVVRKKNLSPIFLKRLQSQEIDVGQKLLLEVEIGGSPVPEVTWYFNGNRISESPTRFFRVEGTHYMLHTQNIQVN